MTESDLHFRAASINSAPTVHVPAIDRDYYLFASEHVDNVEHENEQRLRDRAGDLIVPAATSPRGRGRGRGGRGGGGGGGGLEGGGGGGRGA